MRAVLVLFDSLNRRALRPYGGAVPTPNFDRLASRATTFDGAWVGSMPCIPARREFHTGRNNFLHRSWGPLEPFDESMPQRLGEAGIHTHLVTDHYHYFEDGGSGFHTRYSTWELVRGLAGDPWKPRPGLDGEPDNHFGAGMFGGHWRQEWVNRAHLAGRQPQTQTFDLAEEFLDANTHVDNWFLHVESFDPHEPFVPDQQDWDAIGDDDGGPEFHWPPYRRVQETEDEIAQVNRRYEAVLMRCDRQLGRILDQFDERSLWDDTMLIVTTDHGLLLGEHGWWGKAGPRGRSGPRWFNELARVPLFIAHPQAGRSNHAPDLVSMVDLPATLLDHFGVEPPATMQGESLVPVVKGGEVQRSGHLFGIFGGHVNVTDGRWVYMRAPASDDNLPMSQYTLMPQELAGRMTPDLLSRAELVDGPGFTDGSPLLRIPVDHPIDLSGQPSALYDCELDPGQMEPVDDPEHEARLINEMATLLEASEAPVEQFQRLGLAVQVTSQQWFVRPDEPGS